MGHLLALEALDVRGCRLRELPDALCCCTRLRHLNARCNADLEYLPRVRSSTQHQSYQVDDYSRDHQLLLAV